MNDQSLATRLVVFYWNNMYWVIFMINLFKKHKRSLGAYALFAFLSFVAIVPFFAANRIFGQGDLLFHLNRILGIAEGLKQGELPYRVFNVLADTGSAVNFFYPFIYILGFSVLFNAINNVVMAFYIGEMILLFVTLIVEYQVMMSSRRRINYNQFYLLFYMALLHIVVIWRLINLFWAKRLHTPFCQSPFWVCTTWS